MKGTHAMVVFCLSFIGITLITPMLSFELYPNDIEDNSIDTIEIADVKKGPQIEKMIESDCNPCGANDYNDPLWEINFPFTESCQRLYPITNENSGEIKLTAPTSYEKAVVDLNCMVENETIAEVIIENSSSLSYSRVQQAQSFSIYAKSDLTQISIYGGTPEKKDVSCSFKLLNNSYDGSIIREFNHTIVAGWNSIVFTSPIELKAGKYFLRVDDFVSSSERAWCRSDLGNNDKETYYNEGSGWNLANFDLSLKIYTKKIITPADISLKIEGHSFIEQVDEIAFYEFNCTVNSDLLQLNYAPNDEVLITYSANVTFLRFGGCAISNMEKGNVISWNLSVDSNFASIPYQNYQIRISGFSLDHTNLKAYNGESLVSYEMSESSSMIIVAEVDRIVFDSPNKLEVSSINEDVNQNDVLVVNGSILEEGWVKITALSGDQIIFENSSYEIEDFEFVWKPSIYLNILSLDVQLELFSPNQYGFFEKSYSYQRFSQFDALSQSFFALDPLTVECDYYDSFTLDTIENASVRFEVDGRRGTFSQTSGGNYATYLVPHSEAIEPGNYSMNVIASKEGYNSISTQIPVEIFARQAKIQIGPSDLKSKTGKKVEFSISLRDQVTQEKLLVPVDLKFSLVRGEEEYYHFWGYNLTYDHYVEWKIPEEIQEGQYSLKVDVVDPYYEGKIDIESAISITPSIPLQIILPVVLFSSFILIIGGFKIKKESVRKTVRGVILVHEDGVPLAEIMHDEGVAEDPVLVSGAITGTMGMFHQVTGKKIRTIGVEGGYIAVYGGEGFKVIIFLKKNPWWIRSNIKELAENIYDKYGKYIIHFDGKLKKINLFSLIKRNFGVKSEVIRAFKDQSSGEKVSGKLLKYMTKKEISKPKIKKTKLNIARND